MSYWGIPSTPVPMVTSEQNMKGTADSNLLSLNTDKLNMEIEYITFLSEFSPYSNAVLKPPNDTVLTYPITKDTPFFAGFLNRT